MARCEGKKVGGEASILTRSVSEDPLESAVFGCFSTRPSLTLRVSVFALHFAPFGLSLHSHARLKTIL